MSDRVHASIDLRRTDGREKNTDDLTYKTRVHQQFSESKSQDNTRREKQVKAKTNVCQKQLRVMRRRVRNSI